MEDRTLRSCLAFGNAESLITGMCLMLHQTGKCKGSQVRTKSTAAKDPSFRNMSSGLGSNDSSSSHLFSTRKIDNAEDSARVSVSNVPEQVDSENDDEVKMDALQYNVEGAGKHAYSSLKDILLQVKSLVERLVPVEIHNIPDAENRKFESIIERVLHEIPEYLFGKFILKTHRSHHKGIISGRIFTVLDEWNGGVASQDSIMSTNQNQRRAPDVEWRQIPLTDAQENNSALPRYMPDLWIEICYNRTGDRDIAFGKIQAHSPSQSTVFVAIVLANQVSPAMRQRLGVIGRQLVPPTIAAPGSANCPRSGPYMAVWHLGSVAAVYYDVRRGHYVDLQLSAHAPNPAPVFRFDMDLICRSLQ
jgi:sulfite reductase alpha subunit-like flavoprotein